MRVEIFIFLVLSVACSVASAQYCGTLPGPAYAGPSNYRYTSRYRNYEFGFSLNIPHDLVGYAQAPPAPDHGVGILLSQEPRSYMYVGADWSSSEYESLVSAKRDHLEWIKKDSQAVISVKDLTASPRLFKSIRFLVRYTCPNSKLIYVYDETIALREHEGIHYSFLLLTTDDRYPGDKRTLEKILRGWTMDPIK